MRRSAETYTLILLLFVQVLASGACRVGVYVDCTSWRGLKLPVLARQEVCLRASTYTCL